ncbi:F-type H+-transporting ATPase subunit gamma [Rhodococcus sp. PvR044]|jgi:F-type H+-transporting ATPase subunit gamma|uniref:ATP synthase gamma chain n=1 Tax=Rhodococcus oryzae TaxID=2571143 RepID=A0ABY2RFK5_9NOCA|nr:MULTISPECIES: F0F1 ATP synthase subunit gamma [Rhodococcus]AQA23614.1 ATP synthase F1, gamma subunit [Rhodococcus sp. MTM3W5.2]MBP1159657.1 F-type H+-transporting ATPase subunit gamma [Rhodococcus sp. PvR099]MCZ4558035.1 F0F1 ATP synthase subunit gamma [Rhodococcus maanshanensis]PTR37429.1 ATP synthase F1 subcomplex gamma subunit [Rhodococcus sp. OK611]TJZ75700.1 F0F1 ATP synthase subunit gamma [Rhodococcus oryzae]
MASLRELRSRIKSVNSTKKITKAQELIATSRITKAQARVAASKPYAEEITKVLSALASASGSLDHPLLNERPEPKRAAVLVVTSDRGMCGGYNSNVLKEAEELIQLLRSEGKEPVLYAMGAKGLTYYTFRDRDLKGAWTGFSQQPGYADAAKASRHLVELFMAGSGAEVAAYNGEGTVEGVDELHIVYTRFVSMLTQTPEVRRMAPLEVEYKDENFELGEDMLSDSNGANPTAQYDFEPEAGTLLSALLPKYISTRIYSSLLDAAASESASRRTAMKAATDNANELVNTLSRQANQVRQAQITQEISEIVGGANALASSAGSD